MSGSTASTPQANDVLENIDAGINSLNSGTVPQKANNNTPRRSQIEILQSIAVGVDGLAGAIAEGAGVSEATVQSLVQDVTATALGAKADKTYVDDNKLAKTGSTATDLKLDSDPVDDKDVLRKSWYDVRRNTFTTRADLAAARIPTSVTRVTTLFYDNTKIRAKARTSWRVWGTSAPTDGRDYIRSVDGRYWVICDTELNPYQFGAVGDYSDDDAALAALWNTAMAMGAGAATNPALNLPHIHIPRGSFRGRSVVWDSNNTGVVIEGPGILDGVQIKVRGQKWRMAYFTMMNSAAPGTPPWVSGTTAIEIFSGANNVELCQLKISGYETGVLPRYGAARGLFDGLQISACRIDFDGSGGGDGRASDCEFAGDAYTDANILMRGSRELKFSNCRGRNSKFGGLYLRGGPVQALLEQYLTNCTFTNDITTTKNIVGVVNNGSGKARVTLTPMVVLNSASAAPTTVGYFGRGDSPTGAWTWFTLAGTAGTVNNLYVDGVALLSATIPYSTSASYTQQLVADAINSRTSVHGYTARTSYSLGSTTQAVLEIYAPTSLYGAANGKQLTVDVSGGLSATFPSFIVVTTSSDHGFSGSEDVHLLTASDTEPGAIEPIWGCPSTTSFILRMSLSDFTGFERGAFTRCCVAQRLRSGLPGIVIAGTEVAAYNGTWDTLAVGPNWLDITPTNSSNGVTYTADATTGTITRQNWDVVLDSEGTLSTNVCDGWESGGNEGRRLIRSAYNWMVTGKRIAAHVHVDPRATSAMRSALLTFIVQKRNRAPNGYGDFSISGADRGWSILGHINPNSLQTPDTSQGIAIETPWTGGGISNMAAQTNRIGARGDGLRFKVTGVEYTWGASSFSIGPHLMNNLALGNGVALGSIASGPNATITATGTDTNIGLRLLSKGTYAIELRPGDLRTMVFNYVASAVNYLSVYPSITGSPTRIAATGTDTNIDVSLEAKGTGRLRIGAHTTSSDAAITGYIEVKDSSGTVRKLAVIS